MVYIAEIVQAVKKILYFLGDPNEEMCGFAQNLNSLDRKGKLIP